MSTSQRFITLKGLSGILAGVFALIGAYLSYSKISDKYFFKDGKLLGDMSADMMIYLGILGIVILILTIVSAIIIGKRRHKDQLMLWAGASKHIWFNLFVPLVAAFVFAGALFYAGTNGLVMPVFILFYGLALMNASKHSTYHIRVLAICEIILGLVAIFNTGYGILFWTLGFGVFHVLFGLLTIRSQQGSEQIK